MLKFIEAFPKSLRKEILEFNLEMVTGKLSFLALQTDLLEFIKMHQGKDSFLLKTQLFGDKNKDFKTSNNGIIYFKDRICVSDMEFLKGQILTEAHQTPYSVHLRVSKMYEDLRENYWWPNKKNEVAKFMLKCLTCQKVKAESQYPGRELQKESFQNGKWK